MPVSCEMELGEGRKRKLGKSLPSLYTTHQGTDHPKAALLIRRKSALPQDFETATALQQYEAKDKILASAEES